MITTEAWVLTRGSDGAGSALDTGDFRRERFSFPDLEDDPDIDLDERRHGADAAYRARYQEHEAALLREVSERTEGRGVAIFVDYVGAPVSRVTQKALGRQGVLATAGWLGGMITPMNRAIECMRRHIHVHTHYTRRSDLADAMEYSHNTECIPDVTEVHDWEDVPRLARAAASGGTRSFFPVYRVNPVRADPAR